MKPFRSFLVFLVFVLIAGTLLSLVTPTSQRVEKSVTIRASAPEVFKQLSRLENFRRWSAWSRQDSAATYTLTGQDGTKGASLSWKGDPGVSGEGRIEIIALEQDRSISLDFHFLTPRKTNGSSTFTVAENNGMTTVTWLFTMATPRPWNIFNLFYSMEKEMGKDFEQGLDALKQLAELQAGLAPAKNYEVRTMDFPATRFAMIRQLVNWNDMPSFFTQHIPILHDAAKKSNIPAGASAGLYFVWDEKNRQADMAAAVPVPAGTQLQHPIIRMTDVAAGKAVYVTLTGDYAQLTDAHSSIDRYLAENKLAHKTPVIEQYIHGPANEKDTAKWLTKIVYLIN